LLASVQLVAPVAHVVPVVLLAPVAPLVLRLSLPINLWTSRCCSTLCVFSRGWMASDAPWCGCCGSGVVVRRRVRSWFSGRCRSGCAPWDRWALGRAGRDVSHGGYPWISRTRQWDSGRLRL